MCVGESQRCKTSVTTAFQGSVLVTLKATWISILVSGHSLMNRQKGPTS